MTRPFYMHHNSTVGGIFGHQAVSMPSEALMTITKTGNSKVLAVFTAPH